MGKNSRVKKVGRKKAPAPSEKAVRLAANQIRREQQKMKDEMFGDFIECVYPAAEWSAFVQLMYCTLITMRDKYGFGKKRLNDVAGYLQNQYECLVEGRVTPKEISDELFEIIGVRYEVDEGDLADVIVKTLKRRKRLILRKNGWVPVHIGDPAINGTYVVTLEANKTGVRLVDMAQYHDRWICMKGWRVVAWQSPPSAYKEN